MVSWHDHNARTISSNEAICKLLDKFERRSILRGKFRIGIGCSKCDTLHDVAANYDRIGFLNDWLLVYVSLAITNQRGNKFGV